MRLSAQHLTVRYSRSGSPALEDVSLSLGLGELVALVGPNGSGKTTLLRALLGTVPLESGRVEIAERALAAWPPRDLARMVGVVPQREDLLFPLRVRETVALGRYAHLGALAAEGDVDRRVVAEAMRRCDLEALSERKTDTLSSGEWQRTRIARALAQEPKILMLDEPTAALDVRHEMEVFELVRRLVDEGLAGLIVTHHLNLAARYADRLVLLSRGRIAGEGAPSIILRRDVVAGVFDWPVAVTAWSDGSPQVVPLRPREVEAGGRDAR
jgi:ABC-type cobalamin/Fe3+-siderophores transport system ATPase subunit